MRQAYDYWQNQPGNYRAPGLAYRREGRAGEISKLLVGALERAARQRPRQGRGRRYGQSAFPLFCSPGQTVRRTEPAWAVRLGHPGRRTRTRRVDHGGVSGARLQPVVLRAGSGQAASPAHSTQPAGGAQWASPLSRASPVTP